MAARPDGVSTIGALPPASKHVRVEPDRRLGPWDCAEPLALLDLSKNTATTRLPSGLICHVIKATDCRSLTSLGPGIRCRELILDGSAIESIPAGTQVEFRLSARNCQRLRSLPDGLRCGVVNLRDCLALEALPGDLSAAFLDLSGCSALKALPDDLHLRGGRLDIRDCPLIDRLPAGAGSVAQLDVSGCRQITDIPAALRVASWLDIGGSGLTALPPHLRNVILRWRGVPIDERIAFRPHELGVQEILQERNAEVRRVMLERYGFEAFMAAADAEVLDTDRDPGGERKLLRVPLEQDEPLVCVSVFCPSTARRYFLRVPPHVGTCRQAIAWTAGFDDPNDYAPRLET